MLPMLAPYPGRATTDMQSFYKKTMQVRNAQLFNSPVGMSHYDHLSRVKNATEMSVINQNLTVDRRARCFVVECFDSPFICTTVSQRLRLIGDLRPVGESGGECEEGYTCYTEVSFTIIVNATRLCLREEPSNFQSMQKVYARIFITQNSSLLFFYDSGDGGMIRKDQKPLGGSGSLGTHNPRS